LRTRLLPGMLNLKKLAVKTGNSSPYGLADRNSFSNWSIQIDNSLFMAIHIITKDTPLPYTKT
jgi:hypothetical protein